MHPSEGVFGTCSGFTDMPCGGGRGYANDDIFYLEVCLFAVVCANGQQLFQVDAAQNFECQIDAPAVRELQGWLVAGPA